MVRTVPTAVRLQAPLDNYVVYIVYMIILVPSETVLSMT